MNEMVGTKVITVETLGCLEDADSHQKHITEKVRDELEYGFHVTSASTTATTLNDRMLRITTIVLG